MGGMSTFGTAGDEIITRYRIRLDGPTGMHSYIVEGPKGAKQQAVARVLGLATLAHGEKWVAAADITVEDIGPTPVTKLWKPPGA